MRPRRPPPEPESIGIRVLYEDESVIAVDKPPGMVVHPTYRNWSGTLLNAVLWHIRGRSDAAPGILTRLDKDTSGIVLIALTPCIHAKLQEDAAAGAMRKQYLAIVHGTPMPERGTIELALGRSLDDRRLVVVDPAGQASRTKYDVLSSSQGYSLVRCELVTGRTHQIRVHLATKGWPIAGDRVYGQPDGRLGRQALHAWRVAFRHPSSNQLLEIESGLPADLQEFLKLQNLTL